MLKQVNIETQIAGSAEEAWELLQAYSYSARLSITGRWGRMGFNQAQRHPWQLTSE